MTCLLPHWERSPRCLEWIERRRGDERRGKGLIVLSAEWLCGQVMVWAAYRVLR